MSEYTSSRALVAMSGGVDSSVAAYLTKSAGYDTIGVTMKLYTNEEIGVASDKTCCTQKDAEDAALVARKIGIPFYVFRFTEDFEEEVIRRFVETYQKGGTPNPCIDCNRYIKFRGLYRRAKELGRDLLVTGHYARVEQDSSGRWVLKKGLDESKDQSYVLYCLTPDQLAHTRFPLGSYHKTEVRQIAEDQGFINARKRDSQDICFVPDGRYAEFIDRYTMTPDRGGNFVDADGKILGRHKGFCRYTIGQRKKLGISLSEPLSVCQKNPSDGSILLTPEEDLYKDRLTADDFNWSALDTPTFPIRCKAKIRYKAAEADATVCGYTDDGAVEIRFDCPQRAITPGQAVVLYDGDLVLGGGTIRAN